MKNWEKFLTTLKRILKAPSSRWILVCLKDSRKHCLTYFWCLNKRSHSPILILVFDWNIFLKFRTVWHLEKMGMTRNSIFETRKSCSFRFNFLFFSSSISSHIYYGSERKPDVTLLSLPRNLLGYNVEFTRYVSFFPSCCRWQCCQTLHH